jgi:hypothetical protein
MTKIQIFRQKRFGHLRLKIEIYLACLREAPPAKALCGGQALRRRQGFAIWYLEFQPCLVPAMPG